MISYNKNGFFMVNGYGNRNHCYHPYIEKSSQVYPSKLIPALEKDITKSINIATPNAGISRNVIYERTNIILSLQNIRYLNKHLLNNDDPDNASTVKASTADKVIDYFKENDIDFSCLLHGKDENGYIPDIFTENVTFSDTNSNPYSISNSPDFMHSLSKKEQEEIKDFARNHRNYLELKHDQKLMIAIAWVTPHERRLFHMYPNTIFCDVTSDTNKEKRPFFTVTGKDSMGNMFTILRAYLPNKKSWIFCWLFNIIFPKYFPKHILNRIKYVCSDGDPREFQQIDEAISRYFPTAKRGRCGWHINNRTWHRYGPRLSTINRSHFLFKKHSTRLSNWIYSWMKPSCETEKEYLLSKALFFQYLKTPEVRLEIGTRFCVEVENMVRCYIEPHEAKFVFYEKVGLRHFDEYSNSCHEGTNKGLKFDANKVGPSLLLDNSAQRVTQQGKVRYEQFCIDATRQVTKSQVWSNQFEHLSKHIVQRGIFLLNEQFNVHSNYENEKIGEHSWMVRMCPKLDKARTSSMHSVHPIYSRIRTVTVQNSRMKCSCKYFERVGLICRHMFNVMATFKHYQGPSHHDISVHWWANYYKNACLGTTLSQGFEKLYDNDVTGPFIDYSHYEFFTYALVLCDPDWHNDPNYPKVVNVELNFPQIKKLLETISIPIGCSQISSSEYKQSDMVDTSNSVTEIVDFEENNIMSHDELAYPGIEFQLNQSIDEESDLPDHASAFEFLYPSFKEMCSLADGVCDKKRLLFLRKWIDEQAIENMKLSVEQSKKRKQAYNKGTYVSSALPNNTKRKTHGNKF